MHGMDHLAWYKDLTTSELINCVTRLTREMVVNPYSPYVRDELESIQAEVDYRLAKLER
jgi:hypothetical protein